MIECGLKPEEEQRAHGVPNLMKNSFFVKKIYIYTTYFATTEAKETFQYFKIEYGEENREYVHKCVRWRGGGVKSSANHEPNLKL